jgi:tetratricopeptide (TPR) repeat protein
MVIHGNTLGLDHRRSKSRLHASVVAWACAAGQTVYSRFDTTPGFSDKRGVEMWVTYASAGLLALRARRPYGPAAALTVLCMHSTTVQASDWDDCFNETNTKTVIEGCSRIIASDHLPNWQRSMALNNRASALLQSGDFAGAEDHYTRALALDPHYAKAYANRGTVRHKSGNLEGALHDFTRALTLDSDYTEAYHNRGVVYEKLGQYDKAILDFTAALSRKPDLYFSLNDRGVAYRKKGSVRRAVADFDAAIAISPQYANAYNNRAKAYFDLQDDGQAVSDASQAIHLWPEFADAFHTRGRALERLGRLTEAIEDYQRTIALDETNVAAQSDLNRVTRTK